MILEKNIKIIQQKLLARKNIVPIKAIQSVQYHYKY